MHLKCRIAGGSPDGHNGLVAEPNETPAEFYCPACAQPVAEPLVCGDCHALICRQCGTPLERIDELGIG